MKETIPAVLLVFSVLGCGPRMGSHSLGPVSCSSRPPVTATPFRADQADALAGSYRFVLVTTTPGLETSDSGLVRLWVADSLHRRARRLPWAVRYQPVVPARQLTGVGRMDDWSDPQLEGHDPDWPGAQVRGDTLLLGRELVNDYSPSTVVITGTSSNAIWGHWSRDFGLVVIVDSSGVSHRRVEGHFCAWRVPRESTEGLLPAGN